MLRIWPRTLARAGADRPPGLSLSPQGTHAPPSRRSAWPIMFETAKDPMPTTARLPLLFRRLLAGDNRISATLATCSGVPWLAGNVEPQHPRAARLQQAGNLGPDPAGGAGDGQRSVLHRPCLSFPLSVAVHDPLVVRVGLEPPFA